ncbi:putative AIF-like mitochondrial oxidoreductase (Nfrl) [Aspergillus affinis]|uniref:putative AIF-like mitochondrial oxidoreductase (Nfrl) n=1 Tax=Aspergillus affinis TaxID=1070780 RepID=UPI0022FED58F|nr:AIF-like mitochondrial oxidoreductase [Aspergillus affinis]KAI9043535.1 AIF-like mitochondrial oxidoreductase [Aspergillus affinis]
MAQEYKLKDITSLSTLKELDKLESEVEGIDEAKILLVKHNGQVHALSHKCTHYGAPLKLGVVAPDGRITCPWHGACFNVGTGDVEDAPAPNALNKFEVEEKNGAVYIKGEESVIKSGQRDPAVKCSVSSADAGRVVVVGGGSGTLGTIQALRELKYKGPITVISREPNLIIDRPKLSKALIPDAEKIQLRPREWYQEASIDTVSDEVTGVDFAKKTVATKSGASYPYTKLVLATGGVPRGLPLEGFKDLGNIFQLRDVTHVQSILGAVGEKNKKIVVIGSSFIGMEVGNALAKDNEVTIVGQEKAPMERVMGEKVGRIFQNNLEKAGVKFKLEAGVVKATPSETDAGKVGAVHLNDGSVLPADLVVLGVGVRPATDFLRDNAAVQLEKDGSLKTDEHFAVPGLNNDVFAIGDIATYPYHGPGTDPKTGTYTRIEHWNVAQNAGRGVARAIVHSQTSLSASSALQSLKPKAFIPIFWSALGAQLRYCGNTPNGWDGLVLQGELENAKFAAYYTKGDTVVAVATMGMDPIMAQSAELMRRGNMPTKSQIEGGLDVLTVGVPKTVKINYLKLLLYLLFEFGNIIFQQINFIVQHLNETALNGLITSHHDGDSKAKDRPHLRGIWSKFLCLYRLEV